MKSKLGKALAKQQHLLISLSEEELDIANIKKEVLENLNLLIDITKDYNRVINTLTKGD